MITKTKFVKEAFTGPKALWGLNGEGRVGRFIVKMALSKNSDRFSVEWSPCQPSDTNPLTPYEQRQYRTMRGKMFAEFERLSGVKVTLR